MQAVIFQPAFFPADYYPRGENFLLPPERETALFPAPEACKIPAAILEEGSEGSHG